MGSTDAKSTMHRNTISAYNTEHITQIIDLLLVKYLMCQCWNWMYHYVNECLKKWKLLKTFRYIQIIH